MKNLILVQIINYEFIRQIVISSTRTMNGAIEDFEWEIKQIIIKLIV